MTGDARFHWRATNCSILLRFALKCITYNRHQNQTVAFNYYFKTMVGYNKNCQHALFCIHFKVKSCVVFIILFFGCSHERVLESITEEAEKRDIERFQPLLAGMNNQNIALKVKPHMNIYTWTVTFTDEHFGLRFVQMHFRIERTSNSNCSVKDLLWICTQTLCFYCF